MAQKRIQLSLSEELYKQVQEMSKHYNISVPETMRKIFVDYYSGEYRKQTLGYFGGIKTTGANVNQKEKKQNLEDVLNAIHTLPPEEAMKLVREVGFITPKHEEDNGCTYIIEGEDENRDLIMIYGSGSRAGCYGSWVMLASDLRKHLKANK